MTSKVEICSNALLLVGQSPISSPGEGDRGVLMESLYNQVRRATIRRHVWNFAKWRDTLAPDTVGPGFEWNYRFTLPGDCLRPLWIGERGETYDYDVEGRSILFDEDALPLSYLRDVDDENAFDALFTDALCANLAFTAAYPLTKDGALQKAMYALYTQKLIDAAAVNSLEIPPAEISGSPLLNARRRRG